MKPWRIFDHTGVLAGQWNIELPVDRSGNPGVVTIPIHESVTDWYLEHLAYDSRLGGFIAPEGFPFARLRFFEPWPNFPPHPPVTGRHVIYGQDRTVLGILGLTDAEFQLLRRNGNLVLMSAMPDARGPLKPGDDMTAAYSYQCHQCTIKVELGPHPSVRPILRCVAGAEHLDKLEHFESTAAALKRIGDTIERGKRSRDWVMPISNDDGTDDA